MSQTEERMVTEEVRDRAVLPVLIPLAAIVVTEIVVFSMSRVLLAAGVTNAVLIAIGVSVAILVGSAAIAYRPRIRSSSIVTLCVLLLIGTAGVGAVAFQQGPFYERAGAEGHGAELPTVEVGAANIQFDTDTIEMPAEGAVIHFVNEDTAPHNIAIFPDADSLGDPLFSGEIINGDEEVAYEVTGLEPGEYYFHCDVHPTMSGTAVVGE